jgi:hypothetical protein
MLIYNRVGVTGTGRQCLATAGTTAGLVRQKISGDIHLIVQDADNIDTFLSPKITINNDEKSSFFNKNCAFEENNFGPSF